LKTKSNTPSTLNNKHITNVSVLSQFLSHSSEFYPLFSRVMLAFSMLRRHISLRNNQFRACMIDAQRRSAPRQLFDYDCAHARTRALSLEFRPRLKTVSKFYVRLSGRTSAKYRHCVQTRDKILIRYLPSNGLLSERTETKGGRKREINK